MREGAPFRLIKKGPLQTFRDLQKCSHLVKQIIRITPLRKLMALMYYDGFVKFSVFRRQGSLE